MSYLRTSHHRFIYPLSPFLDAMPSQTRAKVRNSYGPRTLLAGLLCVLVGTLLWCSRAVDGLTEELLDTASARMITVGCLLCGAATLQIYQLTCQSHSHEIHSLRALANSGGEQTLRTGTAHVVDRRTGKRVLESGLEWFPLLKLVYAAHQSILVDTFCEWMAEAWGRAAPSVANLMRVAFLERSVSRYWVSSLARQHNTDLQEYVVPPGGYRSLQGFFTRQVKPERRPIH